MFNHAPKDYQCPLCDLVQGKETEYNKLSDVVYEDDSCLAFISPKWWINNPGNVIVIPKKHQENIYDIDEDSLSKVNILGKKLAQAMKEVYQCEGVSFRQHNEPAGNQDLWHFHLHVFPRYKDDNLYLFYPAQDKKRFVSIEERSVFAEKLKNYLNPAS